MSLTTCTIHVTQRLERAVFLTSELASALKLAKTRSVTLRLGSKSLELSLRLLKKTGKHMYLPATLYKQLHIPRLGSTLIQSSGGGKELEIGPLIGILTSVSSSSTAPFGSRTEFIRQFMRVGSDKAYYFAFSQNQVNWNQGTVTATIPRSEGGWVRKVVPLPDVVYNRLPSRKAESSLR